MILKEDGLEIEVGSIGVQFDGWHWGIDSIVPMREEDGEGSGKDRADCVRQFRAAWDRFSADPARLSEFQAAAMIKRVTLEPPPEVARRFFEDMSAFHREQPDQAGRDCRAPASRSSNGFAADGPHRRDLIGRRWRGLTVVGKILQRTCTQFPMSAFRRSYFVARRLAV